jgi:hypothetical protein
MRYHRIIALCCILMAAIHLPGQCIFAPDEVCVDQCGPVFYLVADPPGTEYTWSISCGTITNESQANPHVACFTSPGICTLQVIIRVPLEEPDTCTVLVDVKPHADGFLEALICPEDSISINGMYYREGNWIDTLFGESVNGCDSILFIDITTFDPVIEYESYTGCTGDGYSVVVNDTTYNEANPSGTQLLETVNGCDSIIVVDLVYLPLTFDTFFYEGCEGDGFEIQINDALYNESNPTGTEVLTGSNGCDSILTIYFVFYPITYGYELYEGCEGDDYFVEVDSVIYNEANPFGVDTLINQYGCDSIVTISLTYAPPAHDTISYIGCMGDGYSIEVLGYVFDESNPSGTFVVIPPTGCDSIVTVDLQFLDCVPSLHLVGDQICVSDSADQYQWYSCDGNFLPDTTQCVTVADTGCICAIVTDGADIDTVCTDYKVCLLEAFVHVPDSVCGLDSVLFYYISTDTMISSVIWEIEIDSNTTLQYSSLDSIWVSFDVAGCYEVTLRIIADGCLFTFVDIVCVNGVPESFFCCTQPLCDSCVTLNVFLSGTPPWTVAISNGTSTDTITGIQQSVFEYVDCPLTAPVEYTMTMMKDGFCEGIIFDSIVSVFEPLPIDPLIFFQDDTLCTDFVGGVNYRWRKCEDQQTLSTDVCFVPSTSGCYCVELTDMTFGCAYSTCDVFILSEVGEMNPEYPFSLWYNREEHSIDVVGHATDIHDVQVQLSDIQGRVISYTEIETVDVNMSRIHLEDHMPSWVFVSMMSDHLSTTRGIFIPME